MIGLPQTGDRPGNAGVDSTLAGMGSEIGWIRVSKPNSMADQGVALCPLPLVNNPGWEGSDEMEQACGTDAQLGAGRTLTADIRFDRGDGPALTARLW